MAVLMITHGSRRGDFNDDMANVASYISRRLGVQIYLAHNEYSEPNWRSVLRDLVLKGYGKVVVVLAFLGRGNHVMRDIMGELGVGEFNRWVKAKYGGREVNIYVTKPLSDSELVKLALVMRVRAALDFDQGPSYAYDPEEIERDSMKHVRQIVREIANVDGIELEIISRVVYASGNPELAKHVYISEDAVDSGIEALRAGVPILTDVRMVKEGIRWNRVENYLDEAAELASRLGITRAAAAMRLGLGSPKIVVVGNSPTALAEALRIHRERGVEIPLVVASPPGFINAPAVKEELIRSGIPCIVVRGTFGGSGIAVAVMNELIRWVLNGG